MKRALSCFLACLQGSPGTPGAAGPIGPAGVRVSTDRLVLMATMLSGFLKHKQYLHRFSLFISYFQGPPGKEGPAGPRGPAGPMVRVFNGLLGVQALTRVHLGAASCAVGRSVCT